LGGEGRSKELNKNAHVFPISALFCNLKFIVEGEQSCPPPKLSGACPLNSLPPPPPKKKIMASSLGKRNKVLVEFVAQVTTR
jgi:hypothetical protein